MAVKRRPSKRKKEFIQTVTFFFISIFSITSLLVYLWVYNEINLTIRDVEALRTVAAGLENDNKILTNDVSRLQRIDRITQIARDELGMVTAAPETIVVYIDYDDLEEWRD